MSTPQRTFLDGLNRAFDELPRPTLGGAGREFPAYLACGMTGFYVALTVLFGAGTVAGRSMLVLAVVALTAGLSFFLYAFVRMRLAGHEAIVLLEHVWFALGAVALVLRAMGEPVLAYLDVVAVALCAFLAVGRVGCTLAGCCYGRPSTVGVTYDDVARSGIPPHLAGVRLFPVAAVEAAGLVIIGAAGFLMLVRVEPGRVLVWFLLAYAVVRFGLEGLRGARRRQLLGLSLPRWMVVGQAAFALGLTRERPLAESAPGCAALIIAFAASLVVLRLRDPRRRLLAPAHLNELRELAREGGGATASRVPELLVSSRGAALAVSASRPGARHVSVSLGGRRDVQLLCELAARAFPDLHRESARTTPGGVLHVLVPSVSGDGGRPGDAVELSDRLYGDLLRRLQRDRRPARASAR
jgi:hypothetical protein